MHQLYLQQCTFAKYNKEVCFVIINPEKNTPSK